MTYVCEECGRTFANPRSLKVHRRKHGGARYDCTHCGKKYMARVDLEKHKLRCGKHVCSTCHETFAWPHELHRHQLEAHKHLQSKTKRQHCAEGEHNKPKKPRVSENSAESGPSNARAEHSSKVEPPTKPTSNTPQNNTPPEIQSNSNEDTIDHPDDLKDIYHRNRKAIQTKIKHSKVQDLYNYEMNIDNDKLKDKLWDDIFLRQNYKFKINYSFGFILRNTETSELRYYHPSHNNATILEEPSLISNANDFTNFLTTLDTEDILEFARSQRDNSKWVVEVVTNVAFYVTKLPDHPIGAAIFLPDFITKKQSIDPLNINRRTKLPYQDNICLFRCLARHYGAPLSALEKPAKEHFRTYTNEADIKQFKGVKLTELNDIENFFKLNINVYELEENDDKTIAKLIRRSHHNYADTMYLNIHSNHFSFINDFSKYASSFVCRKCGKLWKLSGNLTQHERTCEVGIKKVFKGGVYHSPPCIFDRLDDEGVYVSRERRFFPFRATYDYECYLAKDDIPQGTEKLNWMSSHVPLSVSVCANVPGYEEPKCFITDGDTNKLVRNMMGYLTEIQKTSYGILQTVYQDVTEVLRRKTDEMIVREAEAAGKKPNLLNDNEMETEEAETKGQKNHPLIKLQEDFDNYLQELPVIGFNSGRYDINVIKVHLMEYIHAISSKIDFVVKKNSNFMCIKTENLKFLDILNYLAPGFSYDKLLKAYGASITKGFFPYEWMDDLSKLDHKELPSHADFFSTLKKSNISEADYKYCQEIWESNNMTKFRDFLIWYNDRDVKPMLEAVQNMFNFYTERNIDMFKDGISVPGLTLKYLFSHVNSDTYFTIFNQQNKDLYSLVKNNIVGGPSIIFNRYHEKGVTKIRDQEYGEDAELCESVAGWDANSLYLWAISQEMPTGDYIRRKEGNNFKPEKVNKFGDMTVAWLEWVSATEDIEIRHQRNSGEKRIGKRKLPVDGWCQDTNTVYQLHGCFWHGHRCHLNKDPNGDYKTTNNVNKKSMQELREETAKNTEYLRKLGYSVVEMWECEWRTMTKENKELKKFLKDFHTRKIDGAMSQQELLQKVQNGQLFGMVLCDIHVPDQLKDHFKEMTPIFKNTNIKREDIGDFMRAYAEEEKIMSQPRRSLIGSYFGNQILLATPLLKWYLDHGLQVTKVYEMVEYTPKACFKSFADNVSNARRAGDVDESKAIIAETEKLTGNSAYGKTGTNKEKHRDIKYVSEDEVSKLVNDKRFRHLNQLSDNMYEVEMSKKKIKLDLPLQIAYFVYQYAKLRMLEFYYDFMDTYVDRRHFEYCEMDTDSAYVSIASTSIESLIKPNMQTQFYTDVHKWLPAEACDEHRAEYVRTKCEGRAWETDMECCKERQRFDKRTTGLFKLEFEGDGIVALCSKTYYCFGHKDKYSSKGISKNQNQLNKESYLNVLKTKINGVGSNVGFRLKDNQMYTYSQTRNGLTYFYPKRKVADDGRSTSPLDI